MLQPDAQWRGRLGPDPDAASRVAYAKFPALVGDWFDGRPAWVKLAAQQFQGPDVFYFTCDAAPDVSRRLWLANQAALKGQTRPSFEAVVVTSFLNNGRSLEFRVALEEVMVGHLQFLQPHVLEVGMVYRKKSGSLPYVVNAIRLRRVVGD
jgi:hypothetical protein